MQGRSRRWRCRCWRSGSRQAGMQWRRSIWKAISMMTQAGPSPPVLRRLRRRRSFSREAVNDGPADVDAPECGCQSSRKAEPARGAVWFGLFAARAALIVFSRDLCQIWLHGPETGITVPRPPWRRERCNPLAKHGMPASSPPKMPVDARRGLLPYAVGCRGLPDSSVGPAPLFGGPRPCATLPPRAARGFLSEQLRSVATSRKRFRHACAMPGSAASVPCDPDAAR